MAGTDEVFGALRDVPPGGIRLWAMVASESGARRAVEAGAGGIRVSVTANEEASKRLLNRSVEESFAVVGAVVNAASQLGVPVEVMIATAFGVGASEEPSPAEPVGYACRVLADSGASSVCLGDTTGVASPRRVAALIAEMHEQAVPLESVGMHFHDSRGAGLANVSTALALGIRRFDSAAGGSGGGGYNGLGESGNVASEDVATMLLDLGYETGIDIPRLVATTHKLEDSLGHSLVARVARLEF
jgi:hydroxymethylglutaryl-CoA lyase